MEEYILKRGEAYTFNIYNRYFSEHTPIITTSATGGTTTGEVTEGVVNTWQTSSRKLYTGEVTYSGTGTDLIVYTNDGTLKEQYALQKLKIVFTPITNGTYYLNDAKLEDVGVQLIVQSEYGDFINPEELYHTLIMRRSNRVYSYNYSTDVFDSFLNQFIPAGLRARFKNLPPNISGFLNDASFYNPDDTVLMSGLVSDPEDDILTYQWNYLGMRTDGGAYYAYTVSGVDMPVTLSSPTEISCAGQLPTPPVETLFRFELQTSDSDSTVSGINSVPVYSISGQFRFNSWASTDFCLGDCDLPFSYYVAAPPVPPDPTEQIVHLCTSITAAVTDPPGFTELSMEAPGWVYEGAVLAQSGITMGSTNYSYLGLIKTPTVLSGLTAEAHVGISGQAWPKTQHSFELSYSTSVV